MRHTPLLEPEPHEAPAADGGADVGTVFGLARRLYPIARSLTGPGVRETLAVIGETVPVDVTEVPSGTEVLDWTVPPEWRLHRATISLPDGRAVVDVADHPLHVVQHSRPVSERMRLADLRPHLHTLPEQPGLIPYRTSYYAPAWGFCLRQRTLDALAAEVGEDGELDVRIDAEHVDGSLTYGEVVVPGHTDDEILLSAHACHPALANDNASALAAATTLARDLLAGPALRHTVRFLFAPGTLGAIAWLDRNRQRLGSLRAGLVLANLGDAGGFVYKKSRPGTLDGERPVDRAVRVALRDLGLPLEVRPFTPDGYDERQFGSPGFDLPVGRLTRTPHGEYPEYHTSADDLSLLKPESLEESVAVLRAVIERLDDDATYLNTSPFGEPQLGRRGLYEPMGGKALPPEAAQAALWVLNLSDGHHSLLDVADRSGLPFPAVRAAADRLLDVGLLETVPNPADA